MRSAVAIITNIFFIIRLSSLSSLKLKGLFKKVYAARSRFFSRLPLISVLHFVVLATKVNTGLRLALYRVVKDLYLFVEEQAARHGSIV